MAELTQQQINDFIKLAQTLAEKNPEIARGLGQLTSSIRASKNNFDLLSKNFQRTSFELDAYTKQMKLLSGPGESGFARFVKGMREGNKVIDEYKDTLRDFDRQLEQVGDSAQKQEISIKREAMARRIATAEMQSASMEFVKNVGKNTSTVLAQSTGAFVKGLQGNASATELSSGVLNAAVDVTAGAAKAAGGAMTQAGTSIAGLGKKFAPIGIGLSLLGTATSAAAETTAKLAKFGIEVLSKEVEKTVTAFNTMSRSGAMFADGMTGMRKAAYASNLTLEQFSKVVSENSGVLAASGMGVGDATRKMGAINEQFTKQFGASGKSLRQEMLQLGYSFEEQAALVADTMADLRIGRSSMMQDDAAIAKQTSEYAQSLRTITALTGEDAKRKMDQARSESTQVAFRLKLQELEKQQPGITQKIMQSMQTMDATSKKALMEQLTIGTVVDKAANVMSSGSESFGRKVTGMADLINSGNFSVEEAQRIQAEANEGMEKDLVNFREIGIAGMTGALGDLNTAISGQIANMDKITVDAVESSQRLVEQQKTSNDKLTEGVMKAATAAQDLKIALEEKLLPAVTKFASVTGAILDSVKKQVDEFNKLAPNGKQEGPGIWDKLKSAGAGALTGASIGSTVGGVAGTVVPVIGNAAGAVGGALLGGITGAIAGWFAEKEGKASGGIAEGPAGGYLEKLHGTEAVIPLPDNKSVPVDLKLDQSNLVGNITKSLSSLFTRPNLATGSMLEDKQGGTGILEGLKSAYTELKQNVSSVASTASSAAEQLITPKISSLMDNARRALSGPEGVDIMKTGMTGQAGTETAAMMQKQLELLNDIKELLSSSNSLQQQYVYNTYN